MNKQAKLSLLNVSLAFKFSGAGVYSWDIEATQINREHVKIKRDRFIYSGFNFK